MKEAKFLNIVTVNERRYKIKNFDPFDGGYVVLFVTRKIVPLLKAVNIDFQELLKQDVNEALSSLAALIGPVLDSITREELKEFMATCLSKVEVELAAGYMPVYRAGTFALDEIEQSTKTCFILCFHAIRPILTDFFGESALTGILNLKPSTNP